MRRFAMVLLMTSAIALVPLHAVDAGPACTITGTTGTTVDAEAPPDGEIAPPGWYLLFILTTGRVPSEGRWIRIEP